MTMEDQDLDKDWIVVLRSECPKHEPTSPPTEIEMVVRVLPKVEEWQWAVPQRFSKPTNDTGQAC